MNFLDKIKQGATKATEKAQQTVEITRINQQINGKKREIENKYTKIGEFVFEAYQNGDLSRAELPIHNISNEIKEILKEIDALEQRVQVLRNEKQCVCGKIVAYDTRFCPSCGHQFELEPVKPEPIEPEIPQKVCSNCHAPVEDEDTRFCANCGSPVA